jgi:hypothetical protein
VGVHSLAQLANPENRREILADAIGPCARERFYIAEGELRGDRSGVSKPSVNQLKRALEGGLGLVAGKLGDGAGRQVRCLGSAGRRVRRFGCPLE